MLRCPRDRVKGLAMDPSADSGESTRKAYGVDVLERGHTHATDRHFPARSCPRWRADGVGPARPGARRPHRRLGQPGKPSALAPHDHGGFLARCYRARICPRHAEDRAPRGRVSQSRRSQARAPHWRAGEEGSMPQVPREIIADLIRGGAIVLICQPCLSEFGLKLDDIVPGVQLGSPGYLENFVFADNVRTFTW